MIDELELLKGIVADLTNAGIWALVAYIGYQLAKIILTLWAILFVVVRIVNKIFDHLKASITKAEADALEEENHKLKMEVERTKHMYVLLKEKYSTPPGKGEQQ